MADLKETASLAVQYPILQFFQYSHLPENLQHISKKWHVLAWEMAQLLPRNAETSTALRKLLEGKDAAVRAVIAVESELTSEPPSSAVDRPGHPFVPGYPKPDGSKS